MSYIYGPGAILIDGWGGRNATFFKMLRDGKTIPLVGDGSALLHPGYVDDLADSFVKTAEHNSLTFGQVYNIGGHYALMMKDYISLIATCMGVEPVFEFLPKHKILERFPDLTNERGMTFASQHMCTSINKSERDLGWHPSTPLETGLRENIEWMRSQGII